MTTPKKRSATNRRPPQKATIDPARKRWVRTDNLEFVHYAVPDGEREGGEGANEGWGITHILSFFSKRGSKKVNLSIDLSEMTGEELIAVKQLVDVVFEEAQEVCEHRDRIVQEAFQNGEDTHYRLYRTVPKVVER